MNNVFKNLILVFSGSYLVLLTAFYIVLQFINPIYFPTGIILFVGSFLAIIGICFNVRLLILPMMGFALFRLSKMFTLIDFEKDFYFTLGLTLSSVVPLFLGVLLLLAMRNQRGGAVS